MHDHFTENNGDDNEDLHAILSSERCPPGPLDSRTLAELQHLAPFASVFVEVSGGS